MKVTLTQTSCTYGYTRITWLMFKWLALLVSCVALNAAELRRLPPLPNEPVKTSLTNVQEAIRTLVALDVAVTLQTYTNDAETLAYRFREIADSFKKMSEDGTFSVEHLIAQMAMATMPESLKPARDSLEEVKTALVTVYKRTYAHRGRANILPTEYLTGIANTFSEAIRDGIRRGGKANVVTER